MAGWSWLICSFVFTGTETWFTLLQAQTFIFSPSLFFFFFSSPSFYFFGVTSVADLQIYDI